MSELLQKHYGQKIILLIDEYDVPLAKAFEYGYYSQMLILIRSLLEQALKGNDHLQFVVLTGCMRLSKESIFTGLNNLKDDGYQFGNIKVYCPWDAVCCCSKLCMKPNARPQNYWIHTSSNEAVRKIVQKADNGMTRHEIEKLAADETIQKEIHKASAVNLFLK